MPARAWDELDLLKTNARPIGVCAHHRHELSRSVCDRVSIRVLIKNQLHSQSQHRVVILLSEEVWRSHYKFRLPGQDADASLEPQWMADGCGRGRGGKDGGSVQLYLLLFLLENQAFDSSF